MWKRKYIEDNNLRNTVVFSVGEGKTGERKIFTVIVEKKDPESPNKTIMEHFLAVLVVVTAF